MIEDKDSLEKEIAKSEPNQEMSWMGESLKASELGEKLLNPIPKKKPSPKPKPLSQLIQKKIQIPAVSPWFGGAHPGGMTLDTQIINDQILVSGTWFLCGGNWFDDIIMDFAWLDSELVLGFVTVGQNNEDYAHHE